MHKYTTWTHQWGPTRRRHNGLAHKGPCPLAWASISACNVSNACGVIALLLSHQTVLSVTASRTVNLSFGERPV